MNKKKKKIDVLSSRHKYIFTVYQMILNEEDWLFP